MAYTQGPKNYGLSASVDDVPLMLGSSTLRKPISSSQRLVAISSQNGSQGPSGLHMFQIPTGAGSGFIKPNSMYLRCKVTPTFGAGQIAWSFNGCTGSASALINRLTVMIGNQNVEQKNNYWFEHDLLLAHASNSNYMAYDSQIYEHSGTQIANNAANVGAIDVVIPILSSLFNGNKAVPCFLLNSPISLQFDYNTLGNSMLFAGAGVTTYTVSNAQLCYEVIQVDDSYCQAVRAMMAEGHLFQLNLTSTMNLQTANTGTTNYNIGANLSSLKAVLYTNITNAIGSAAQALFLGNTQTNFRLYLDGRQINNFNLDTEPVIYAEMNRALHNMFDTTVTSVSDLTTYLSNYFLGGVNTNRFNELMAMTGTPAQNINFILENAGGATNIYVCLIYDQLLVIDVTGQVSLVR